MASECYDQWFIKALSLAPVLARMDVSDPHHIAPLNRSHTLYNHIAILCPLYFHLTTKPWAYDGRASWS